MQSVGVGEYVEAVGHRVHRRHRNRPFQEGGKNGVAGEERVLLRGYVCEVKKSRVSV